MYPYYILYLSTKRPKRDLDPLKFLYGSIATALTLNFESLSRDTACRSSGRRSGQLGVEVGA